MNTDSVFQYAQPHEFLAAYLATQQSKHPKFSIRAWSRQIGYKNPSILARILKGERRLKPELAGKIADSIKLTERSKKYFVFLVLLQNAKSQAEKEIYSESLSNLRPDKEFTNLTLDHFRTIADWYHFAILEMTALRDFQANAAWIAKRLDGAITPAVAQSALERLLRLELLQKLPTGEMVRTTTHPFKVGNGLPSDALRKHHSQMIQKGVAAIEAQKVSERQILGTTVTLSPAQIKKAQEIILRCHRDLLAMAASRGTGEETYQLNTQLFLLTRKETSRENK